ncbi:MAG TPA: hypothetical protein VND40_03420 [Nitrososphaerales archaeon]|nr:hypothetical protein [Nitrososphaerales archaeon]
MGLKIMMPPDVVNSVTGALIARQVLREIVNKAVRTPFDEHYFAVMMHKGGSGDLRHMSFNELAKMLSASTQSVHHYVADHMINGGARGGCKYCNGASQELKRLIVEEKDKDHGSEEPFSLWITVASISSAKRRVRPMTRANLQLSR